MARLKVPETLPEEQNNDTPIEPQEDKVIPPLEEKIIPPQEEKTIPNEAAKPDENLVHDEYLKAEIQEFSEEKTDNENPVFQTKYERYEWLLRQKELGEFEKRWICDYQQSDEFEMIYGAENRGKL